MKAKIAMFILALFVLAPLSARGDNTSSIDKLDHISDEALQMVKLYRYEDAKRLLGHFESEFLNAAGSSRPYSMDELRIITVAYDDAEKAVTSVNMGHEERMGRVTKFRLVVDALRSKHQPLWTEMENPILTVFGSVKKAAQEGDNGDFNASLNSFLSLYQMIYPSMKIDITPDRIQQLDARVNFIDNYRPDVLGKSTSQKELDALEADLKTIFDDMTEDEADPSLWWVIISTGSIIIMTLSYVGWRKYKGDREKLLDRQKERKN
ncbi:sporulation protein YpjB [Mesobacillus zeae]|uniref:Sporulation protein YpjB n=1 Tax=Mesobacillus zeae TaxID=1917180 RepID=A0A398AYB3_9BACI|nr:sporulation protein YpjB [Mesobacillus zeae]RID82565.1 sporulation protein YpjB [Mesobacillus zeae]